MKTKHPISRIESGVRNLDAVFGGGLPKGSVVVVIGPPGSGKTILAQQLCFHVASPKSQVLYFNTLSEPTAKTLRYLKPLRFFDQKKLDADLHFVDLGVILRSKGLEQTSALIMERIRKIKPAVVVLDDFKAFDDLAQSKEELRKFVYELGVNLMAWEATCLILGEYRPEDYETSPLFAIMDGLITVTQREASGENQRFIQVVKMRGTSHSRDEHPFIISSGGLEVFAPRVLVRLESRVEEEDELRVQTGIGQLDDLLAGGIPRGSSVLVTGAAGTGKTMLSLELVYRAALAGQRGLYVSFEETTARLLSYAKAMGWDLRHQIELGLVELMFIPQPDIQVESDLLTIGERVASLGATRVAIDSLSVFLHKVKDPQIAREKVFQLTAIVQNAGAVGFFATDIPTDSHQISRFGVEETMVDGVFLLSSIEEGFERHRYLEIYKMRNTAHLNGRHSMAIGPGGVRVFPRYAEDAGHTPVVPSASAERSTSGVPGLDALLGGGLFKQSATLLAGSPGIGKSTWGLQFILAGAERREMGLIFVLEEAGGQLEAIADALDLPLQKWTAKGLVAIVYLSREDLRTGQLAAIVSDQIRERRASRVLLDGVPAVALESGGADERREVVSKLIARFKLLDVTSLMTVESTSLHFGDPFLEHESSPVADNLLMLRYAHVGDELMPALRILKTRGSAHDRRTHVFELGKGGSRIASEPKKSAPRRASSAKAPGTPKAPRTKPRAR